MVDSKELDRHWERILARQDQDFRAGSLRRLIMARLQPGTVLDIGCGTGGLLLALLRAGYQAQGMDISDTMVANAKRALQGRGFSPTLVESRRIEDLPDWKERFDNIVSLDVLEHMEDDLTAIRCIKMVLKPQGKLIVTVPAVPYLYGQRDQLLGHFRRYRRVELRSKLELGGFEVEEIRHWNLLGVAVTFLSEKLLGRKVKEDIRYSDSPLARAVNGTLRCWMQMVENPFSRLSPLGMTLIAVAKPK